MLIIWILTRLLKLWLLCHGSSFKWGPGIRSQLLFALARQSTSSVSRILSLRILETLLVNQKPLKPRLHLATCALSNHLESGILKRGKAPILWLLGMSVCFLCLHAVLGFVWGYLEAPVPKLLYW